MSQSILRGKIDTKKEFETTNEIIKNPIILLRYREIAKKLQINLDNIDYESKNYNDYVFSVCQYYVAVKGKDKKVEKLRGLFAMSKTLTVCFLVLSFISLLSVFFNTETSISIQNILGSSLSNCDKCIEKILYAIIFFVVGVCFYFRSKRVMGNFLLVLLGTYNALISESENKSSCSIKKIHKKENTDLL